MNQQASSTSSEVSSGTRSASSSSGLSGTSRIARPAILQLELHIFVNN